MNPCHRMPTHLVLSRSSATSLHRMPGQALLLSFFVIPHPYNREASPGKPTERPPGTPKVSPAQVSLAKASPAQGSPGQAMPRWPPTGPQELPLTLHHGPPLPPRVRSGLGPSPAGWPYAQCQARPCHGHPWPATPPVAGPHPAQPRFAPANRTDLRGQTISEEHHVRLRRP